MLSAVTLLPQPLSPTMPSVAPSRDLERDLVDRAEHALLGAEGRDEVTHAEQGGFPLAACPWDDDEADMRGMLSSRA